MLTDEKRTREALALDNLTMPPSLPVRVIQAEDHTDWTGDPALRVQVILDESAVIENITGDDIGIFKRSIRDSLRKHGISLFPYIFVAKQSELDEPDEPLTNRSWSI